MPNRVPWTERCFDFTGPTGLFPELIERLRGTPARICEMLAGLPAATLTTRIDDTWSIQENVGHLCDLEELFTGRLDDFLGGVETLRPADMTNRRTHAANHNEHRYEEVLDDLCKRRADLVSMLEALSAEDFGLRAMHPRLGTPMRVIDMMFFHAEHDDYHLARIRELMRLFAVDDGVPVP